MSKSAFRSDRFIGRFANRDAKTGRLTGDQGYIALALDTGGRVPQVLLCVAETLDELIAELKGPKRELLDGGRLVFEPPEPFCLHSARLKAEPSALELHEIYKVQNLLGQA